MFDLLHSDGESLLKQPLETRKRALLDLVGRPSTRADSLPDVVA